MPGNLPIEQDILHLGTLPNIMDNHVAAVLRRFAVNDNSE